MRKHHFDRFSRHHFDDRSLRLDSTNKKLGGVCSGLARYFDVPSLFVRIGALVALCIAPQPTLIAYGLAYIVLDESPDDERFDDL